jgi:hypothetical protein
LGGYLVRRPESICKEEGMRKPFGGLMGALCLIVPLAGLAAGPQAGSEREAGRVSKFDARNDVTLEGRVSRVVSGPAKGLLVGAHLIVSGPAGAVDVHLGDYAMKGPNALSVSPGEKVRVAGIMTTVKGRPVLLARTVQIGTLTYRIRSERGFLLRPVSHDHGKTIRGGRS